MALETGVDVFKGPLFAVANFHFSHVAASHLTNISK